MATNMNLRSQSNIKRAETFFNSSHGEKWFFKLLTTCTLSLTYCEQKTIFTIRFENPYTFFEGMKIKDCGITVCSRSPTEFYRLVTMPWWFKMSSWKVFFFWQIHSRNCFLVSNDRERLRDFWKNTTVPQEITQPCMIMCYE